MVSYSTGGYQIYVRCVDVENNVGVQSMNISPRAVKALRGLTVPDQPPGLCPPCQWPSQFPSICQPLPQWHCCRATLQLPTALPCPATDPTKLIHLWIFLLALSQPMPQPDVWGLPVPPSYPAPGCSVGLTLAARPWRVPQPLSLAHATPL